MEGEVKILPEYHFREARESDFDFLYHLMKLSMKEYVVAAWGSWDEAFQMNYFLKKFNPGKNKIIVIHDTDAGAIMITEDSNNIKVDRFFLMPEFQGKGIGSRIMYALIEEAKESHSL